MKKNYTIGLDIGTNSVGWAVLDDDFNLVKGKKKIKTNESGQWLTKSSRANLWGSRLFDVAKTANENNQGRRAKRGIRRRIARRKKRLEYLRDIFSDEILKFDDSFFIRMDESFIQNGDLDFINKFKYKDKKGKYLQRNKGKLDTKYPLFNGIKGSGESFSTDREYFEQYRTIYHLRKRLVEDKSQADLRLVYLALHHIAKFRGHFVDEEREFKFDNIDIKESLTELIIAWNQFFDDEKKVSTDKNILIEEKLKLPISPSQKVEYILGKAKEENVTNNILDFRAPKVFEQILKFIVGNQGNLKAVFDLDEDLKITAADEDLAEKISVLPDEQQQIVFLAYKVNNDMILSASLLNGSLSAKKVMDYETHKKQLKDLRKYLKDNPDLYEKFFGLNTTFNVKNVNAIKEQLANNNNKGLYTKYIQGEGKDQNKTYATKVNGTTAGFFYKDVREAFKNSGVDLPKWVDKAMVIGNFLPKQRNYKNGSIPYQAHFDELKKILENQGQYYKFLKCDSRGNVVEDMAETKIAQLVKFRIPYYVGTPAVKFDKAKNAWIIRNDGKEDVKMTPWNFDEVVNLPESSNQFIKRMTNFDTYLTKQKVLPEKSILYQKYNVINRLTKVKIKDEWLSADRRNIIFDKLFAGEGKTGKVSKKDLVDFYECEFDETITTADIFGIDGRGFLEQFSTLHELESVGIPLSDLVDEENESKFEDIVEWLSVFNDKKMFIKKLQENYPEYNDFKENLSKLVKRYKGWGRFSKRLLTGLRDKNTHNILWYLMNDPANRNFMQLINDDNLPFKELIEKETNQQDAKVSFDEQVAELATSPANKRGILQSLKIVDEIIKYMGYLPKNVAIEFARENQSTKQGTKDERKKNIQRALEKLKEEFKSEFVCKEKKEDWLKKYENKDFSQRLQLYFLQNGQDMYDGEALKEGPFSPQYEVDHIIPRSLLKNDSIENKVLTKKTNNVTKGDKPAGEIATKKATALWARLSKAGVLSQEKYGKLRKTEFTEEDIKGYINRQLVETRQIMKHVATILKNQYVDKKGKSVVDILTPKAIFASTLRKQNDWVKALAWTETGDIRLNDYNHAQDAYLNGVVALFRKRKGYDSFYQRVIKNAEQKFPEKNSDDSRHRADFIRKKAFQQAKDMDVRVFRKTADDSYQQVPNEYKQYGDNKTGIWWSKEIVDRITQALYPERASELPLISYKTEKQRGAYSKEGNLKKGKGSLVRKNNLSIGRYGGTNKSDTNIAILKGNKIEEVPLVKFDEIKSEIILDKFQLIKNIVFDLKLTNSDKANLEKFYQGRDGKGIRKTLEKVANYKSFDSEEFFNQLSEMTDKQKFIESIIDSSKKFVYRYLTAPTESQKAQQFNLTLFEMRNLKEFLSQKQKGINLDSVILEKILNFVVCTDASPLLNKNNFLTEFDKLPKMDTIEKDRNTVKSAILGQVQVVRDLLMLISRGTSRGLSHFGERYSDKVKWENPMKDTGLSSDIRYNSSEAIVNSSTTLIYQSITGLYETRKKLQ